MRASNPDICLVNKLLKEHGKGFMNSQQYDYWKDIIKKNIFSFGHYITDKSYRIDRMIEVDKARATLAEEREGKGKQAR